MPISIKTAALRFLKIRPRSTAELKEKLEAKDFSATDIAGVLQDLTASRLLDDRAFTKALINYRLARPFGFRRIIQELRSKGVAQDIIDEALSAIKDEYRPDHVALDLAQRRWARLPAILDVQKKKKRVMDFLLRRGFDADVVIKIIKKL